MKKVLIVLTNHNHDEKGHVTGCALEEVSHFCKPIIDAGMEVVFVSPKGETPGMAFYSDWSWDKINQWFKQSNLHDKFNHPNIPSQINADEFSTIYFAGGHGAMWDFPNNQELINIAEKIYATGGVVSAVCHGSAGLLNLSFIKDKHINGFTNAEEILMGGFRYVPFWLETELKKKAKFKQTLPFLPFAITDGRVVTGQNPFSAGMVAKRVLALLNA